VLPAELPFVDRGGLLAGILAMTHAVLEEAQDSLDPQRAIFVKAPEGAGKSRLVAELQRRCEAEELTLFSASCWGDGTSTVEGLQKLVVEIADALGPDSKCSMQYAELIELARKGQPGPGADQGLTNFLRAASYERGFLLHLADIERGPEWVRGFVDTLVRSLEELPAPLAVCVTTAPHLKVEGLLTDLADDRLIEVWGLPTFNRDELAEIARLMFGDMPKADELAELLLTLTGGEPFAVQEALRAMVQENLVVQENEQWVLRTTARATNELEQLLAGRVESRLDALGTGAWEIVTVLFLMERPVRLELLEDLSDLRRRRFARMLDRLTAEGLVLVHGIGGQETVMLAHRTIREAIRVRSQDSLDDRRIDLAARLEELELEDAAMIFLRCELLDDAAHHLEAADELDVGISKLFDMSHHLLGAQLLERNIIKLRQHGGMKSLSRLLTTVTTLLEKAPATLESARREQEHYQIGAFAAQLLGDHRAEAMLWLGLADRWTSGNNDADPDAPIERLEHAARAAAKTGDRALQLKVAGKRAESLVQGGMVSEARAFSDEAIAILDVEGAPDVDVVQVLGARMRLLAFMGDFDEATALHEIARPIAARVPIPQKQSYLSGLSFLSTLSGEYERGLEELEEAIAATRESESSRLLTSPLHNTGDLYLRLGRLDKAAEYFDEASSLCRMFKMGQMTALNQGFLGYTYALQGKVDEGAGLLEDAIADIQGNRGAHVTIIQLRLLMAEVTHMQGRTEDAREELGVLIRQFRQANETSYVALAEEALARITANASEASSSD
jgi:tetratricopeptide (TPR) repeat protein